METPTDTATDEYFAKLQEVLTAGCHEQRKATDCHQLGEFLQSVRKDFEGAAAAFGVSCNNMDMPESCFHLGTLHLVGKGVPQDPQKGAEYYERACAKNSAGACNNLGLMHWRATGGVPRDFERAVRLLRKACDLNFPNACFNLGALHLMGDSGANPETAGGDAPAPYKDRALAFKCSVRACDLGHVYGCVNAARMASLGDGVPKDEALAATLREKAELAQKAGTSEFSFKPK